MHFFVAIFCIATPTPAADIDAIVRFSAAVWVLL
jgi:hypothetical protein